MRLGRQPVLFGATPRISFEFRQANERLAEALDEVIASQWDAFAGLPSNVDRVTFDHVSRIEGLSNCVNRAAHSQEQNYISVISHDGSGLSIPFSQIFQRLSLRELLKSPFDNPVERVIKTQLLPFIQELANTHPAFQEHK